MPLNKRKSFFLQVISSKLFVVTGLAVLIFLGVSLGKEVIRRHQISTRIKDLQQEISQLEGSKTELTDLIEYLKSESFQEREARLKLNLQKEGESVVILPRNTNELVFKNSAGAAHQSRTVSGESASNIQKWWNYFFK